MSGTSAPENNTPTNTGDVNIRSDDSSEIDVTAAYFSSGDVRETPGDGCPIRVQVMMTTAGMEGDVRYTPGDDYPIRCAAHQVMMTTMEALQLPPPIIL